MELGEEIRLIPRERVGKLNLDLETENTAKRTLKKSSKRNLKTEFGSGNQKHRQRQNRQRLMNAFLERKTNDKEIKFYFLGGIEPLGAHAPLFPCSHVPLFSFL